MEMKTSCFFRRLKVAVREGRKSLYVTQSNASITLDLNELLTLSTFETKSIQRDVFIIFAKQKDISQS
jgi:hypothetical protein